MYSSILSREVALKAGWEPPAEMTAHVDVRGVGGADRGDQRRAWTRFARGYSRADGGRKGKARGVDRGLLGSRARRRISPCRRRER